MTTNKPHVQRYDNMGCPEEICRVDTMHESDDGEFVLYEDYEALQAECEKLRKGLDAEQEPVAWIVRHPRFCGKFTDDKEIAEYWESKKQGCTTPLFHHSQQTSDTAQIKDALSRYESMRDNVGGCGDGSCLIKKPSGMATNGGCRCTRDYLKTQRMMMAAQELFNRLTVVCKQGGDLWP